MEIWESLSSRGRHNQFTFHLVCCKRFSELLEQIEREHFVDFSGKKRAQVVNALLTVMEPFLLHQLNLSKSEWELDLKAGKVPFVDDEQELEEARMDRELWVSLDVRIYRLLKKLHESGNNGWSLGDCVEEPGARGRFRWGSFSMAMVLRAALIKCFELLCSLGRDGLVRWVEEWVKTHESKVRPKWDFLKHHMVSLKDTNAKYIALYSDSYRQLHLYHPPPGSKTN